MSLLNFSFVVSQNQAVVSPPDNREIESVDPVDGMHVDQGTAFNDIGLPSTVNAHFSDGSQGPVAVSWLVGDYDENVVDLYVISGTLIPSGTDSNTANVTASINVAVDNPESSISIWVNFNGRNNYARFSDAMDSLISAAAVYFEIHARIRNVPLTGTKMFITKSFTTGNQRQLIIQKINADLNFIWYITGDGTRVRGITWANCLPDTNEHKIVFKYNGAVSTNDGLDRVTLEIDDVVVSSGKTLTTTTGTIGNIFNGSAKFAIGTQVQSNGTLLASTTNYFEGDVRDVKIRDVSTDAYKFFHDAAVTDAPANDGTYKRFMQPILDGTKDPAAIDTCQCSFLAMAEDATTRYMFYLASNPDIDADRDVTCLATQPLSSEVSDPWTKRLSAGLPERIYDVGAVGKFDAKQVWLRNVLWIEELGLYLAFPVGQSATDSFAMGKSSSSDLITWTRLNSGDPVYTDGTTNFTIAHIIKDGTTLRMLYCGNQLGERYVVAESTNWGDTWTVTHTGILLGESLGWPCGFAKIGSTYYIAAAKNLNTFSSISDNIVLYTTTDFAAFLYQGEQIEFKGASEFGVTSQGNMFYQDQNDRWWAIFTSYKNHIGKSANLGEEFTCIRAAKLNRTDLPIAGRKCTVEYPDYVIEHYPLNIEEWSGLNANEKISGGVATINSTPVFTPNASYGNRLLGFVDMQGTQAITKSDALPAWFDPANFAIKVRIEIVTTGTHELFRIGDTTTNKGFILSLVSGKLRCQISVDGTNWAKDWITTVNISKPTGMNYTDNHLFVAASLIGGTLTMFNDFVPFTAAQITETIDLACPSMHYTNGSRVIGDTANMEMRSAAILTTGPVSGAITNQKAIDLEI